MIHSKYGDFDEATALKNLNIVYNCLKNNFPKIAVTYKDIYPEVSDAKLLAYYIARLGFKEVERVIELSLENKL